MKVNFYDVVDVISGGTPRTDVGEFWNGEIPWLSVVDFAKSVKYVYDTEKHITELGLKNSNTKLLNIDDIIISARGTVGAIAMLKIPMAFNQSCFGLRAKREFMNQDYLFYFLKYYMENLKKKTQGSVFSTINLETFRMIDFELPDTNTQIKISKILSCLDSKIENNNKINAELESMAKTLYDYWFLQFEFPNENGKPYKSSGGKMVWNEELKREIPEGWKVSKIGDILEEANKSKIKVNDAKEKGKYPFFTSGEKILCYDDYLVKGFNIFLNTGGNPDIKAYMGKCAYSTDTWCVSAKEYSYILFYYLLKLMPQFEQLFFAGSGLKHLQKDFLKNQYILLPDEKVLRNFNNICELIWKKITNCLIENQELVSLRDFLLPLLMNGQVKFKDN